MPDPQSNLPPKKKTKHVVDGVDYVEAYNKCDEMLLFIDFCKKIEAMEKNLSKDVLLWERKCVNGKVVTVG